MTDKQTPTDAEPKAMWQLHAADIGGIFSYARAVLTKWGQPAGAGEPFGYFHQLLNHEGKGNGVWLGAAERKVVEQAHTPGETSEEIVALYTTQQPTHAQAGAMPLDEARRMFDAGWKAAALFCDREDVVADGIIGSGACPQFEAAFSAAQPVAREPLTDEQIKALMQAHRTAMLMTCKARVPECGEFAAIAQDLDWLCESLGIKGGQHGAE